MSNIIQFPAQRIRARKAASAILSSQVIDFAAKTFKELNFENYSRNNRGNRKRK